eukprot:9380535-Prorocentrum_lima.AAC.1
MNDAGADCPDTTDALAHTSALLDVTRTYSNFVCMIKPFEFEIVDGDGQSIEWAGFYVAPELIKACRATHK